jgi:N-acetyl-gamma-glutamyl-phosphate/LysW-gamma-L-alpha-aminoadipyl-6-phosphate reductase
MIQASIVGGSGYAGGELLRLLLFHPEVTVSQVTSERRRGEFVHAVHPNLRGVTRMKFVAPDDLAPADVLFLAMPHGKAMHLVDRLGERAARIIDLSADHRLRAPADYPRWYGHPHAHPERLDEWVYGIPELHREAIRKARFVTGAGCLATAAILALLPLFRGGVVAGRRAWVEVKVGSSAAGNEASPSTHHPERSHVVRSYEPVGHRHTAEVAQELTLGGDPAVIHLSATAVELVRGALATCQVELSAPLAEKDVWGLYRACYQDERFVRIVKDRSGLHRYPEPKILAGSNFADVGFAVEEGTRRVVAMAAIDNLMKGAAGNAVQAMNVMLGLDERAGLSFPGLHPV